jgi:hypothetical protein
MKRTLLVLTMVTSAFAINAMATEQNDAELTFDPSTVEIIPVDQLQSSRALKSEGGIAAFASAGAWTKVVYNPNITTAGQWVIGPLMNAPSGTSSTAKVTNITWQWNIWNYRSDLITNLCESTVSTIGDCVNISGNFGAGANISSSNIPANRGWRYIFAVPGSINPVLIGQNGSIAVTYQ